MWYKDTTMMPTAAALFGQQNQANLLKNGVA